ncbi:unknown [Clostridium sp. CAG:780]|nr:unknown [Clostridium sp. CAG:780]
MMDKEARRVYSIVICFLMIITVIIKITMANLRLNLTLNVIMIALLAVSVHLNSENIRMRTILEFLMILIATDLGLILTTML